MKSKFSRYEIKYSRYEIKTLSKGGKLMPEREEVFEEEKVLENVLLELRKGTLVLAVLSQLKKPHYGYSLVQDLNDKGLNIDQGTLYPLMRRLEKNNLLDSTWNTDDPRPRKYYVLNENGMLILTKLKEEWDNLINNMKNFL